MARLPKSTMDKKPYNPKQSQLTAIILFPLFLAAQFANPFIAQASLAPQTLSTIDLIAQQIKTPESLASFMSEHFRYEDDERLFGEEDYWQTPEEMLNKKIGDCEDFALFAKQILEKNGYETVIFSVYQEDKAHAVAVFRNGNSWGIFDLDDYRSMEGSSLRDLGDKVDPKWTHLGIMRQVGNQGLISRKFYKESADLTVGDSFKS